MSAKNLRIVHYLNQFFAGLGGEDKAYLGPRVTAGPVGPGKALQESLGNRAEVVATVVCGDNYMAERLDEATDEILRLLQPLRPQAFLAGPAFEAGRYGIACGALCKAVQAHDGLPAVTAMYEENPGVELFRKDVYIVRTGESVMEMRPALARMADLVLRLAEQKPIGKPAEEGYFPRGIIKNELLEKSAAHRVVDILLAKLRGRPFQSEIVLPKFDRVKPAPGIKDLGKARLALVTDGGLVPRGNPDRIELRKATRFGAYDIEGVERLDPSAYEVVHAGYDSTLIALNPHRLVPLDILREFEKQGTVGTLYRQFFATSGTANVVENVKKMGQAIGRRLVEEHVSGVVLTST